MRELPLYWRFFNFMVRRVVAVGFVVVGSLGTLTSIPALIDPDGTVLVNGQRQGDLFYRIIVVILSAVVATFGVLMYRAPPYVPKDLS